MSEAVHVLIGGEIRTEAEQIRFKGTAIQEILKDQVTGGSTVVSPDSQANSPKGDIKLLDHVTVAVELTKEEEEAEAELAALMASAEVMIDSCDGVGLGLKFVRQTKPIENRPLTKLILVGFDHSGKAIVDCWWR